MIIARTLRQAQVSLRAVGIATARLDSLVLFEFVMKKDRTWLLAHGNDELSVSFNTKFQKLIKQRAKNVPVAYLTGGQEFFGLDFKVTPDVLIPRPETEAIVEEALKIKKPAASVLDVGTGCGAIAVAIAKSRPNWSVLATEISPAALDIARRNAKLNQAKLKFLQSNLLNKVSGQFDIITANLPYLKAKAALTEAAKTEPALALFGGSDGLDIYRHFFEQVPSHLNQGGYVIIESDPWQHPELIRIAANVGLKLNAGDRFVLTFKS